MFHVCFFKSCGRSFFVFSMVLVCLGVCASAGVVIDDFSTMQVIPPGGCVTGTDMIGGERDAGIDYGYANANINSSVQGQLYYRSGNRYFNYIHLIYDGIDGSYSSNHGGLGHVDLTEGGTSNGFIFNFTQVPPYYVNIWVDLYQEDGSQGFANTYAINTAQAIFLGFDKFVADEPLAAPPANFAAAYEPPVLVDFTNVGYIRITMSIYGGDDTFVLDSITTGYRVPEPASAMIMILGGVLLRRK